ncbi:MAG: ABC transporter substrate-binding protein, partial [Nitrososphaerales archaeon]
MSSGITKVHSVFLVIIIILAVVAAAGWSRTLTPDQEMSSSEQSKVSVAFLWGGSEGDSFKAVLQQFEKTHPNIKLDMRQIPNEEYRSVITSQIAAGNPPDVVMLPWPSLARELAQEGKITPLNDLWSNWNERGWY